MGSKPASLLFSIWIPEGYLELSTQMYALLLHSFFGLWMAMLSGPFL
jgi:hypothetical protein